MYTENKVGDKEEPWGTPRERGRRLEGLQSGMTTNWERLERKEWNQRTTLLDKERDWSLFSRISWSTVSNALEKSKRTRIESCWLSMAVCRSWVIFRSADWVE